MIFQIMLTLWETMYHCVCYSSLTKTTITYIYTPRKKLHIGDKNYTEFLNVALAVANLPLSFRKVIQCFSLYLQLPVKGTQLIDLAQQHNSLVSQLHVIILISQISILSINLPNVERLNSTVLTYLNLMVVHGRVFHGKVRCWCRRWYYKIEGLREYPLSISDNFLCLHD